MIEQQTQKRIQSEELNLNQINIKDSEEIKPESHKNLMPSARSVREEEEEEQLSENTKKNKTAETTAAQLDLGKEISKLIKLYSKEKSQEKLTLDQFKQLAQDLFSIVEPRDLTKQQLDNLVNLFEQKQKDPKLANAYKPPKTFITKEQLKKKAIENKGSLGFLKKK